MARDIIAKSWASVAIAAMLMAAMFVMTLDVLKYGFSMDIIDEEAEKKKKREAPIFFRFIYVHTPECISKGPIV